MNVSFFQELLNTISERGRSLLDRSRGLDPDAPIEDLVQALIAGRGEASSMAIASAVLARYHGLDADAKRDFFRFLSTEVLPDQDSISQAAQAYLAAPGPESMAALATVVESPRQEFFRRLNLAPGATATIVEMRADLLALLAKDETLAPVNNDLVHLLRSWFNRGFLVLRNIDWSTPASILEKIIAYEAVHEIHGWDELRRRLDPRDRRCFGFFHPSLVDEPVIFVEVALTHDIPGSIQGLLAAQPEESSEAPPTTAVFYSISNCQTGLRGISFGNFLIKQVVEELTKEVPSLRTFVTLSPMPRFAGWLERQRHTDAEGLMSPNERETLALLEEPSWAAHDDQQDTLRSILMPCAAHYLMAARNARNRPVDPVARFHLGNGARLERINWLGDKSEKGLRQAHGLMVNYLYDLKHIEKNHEAYVNENAVIASKSARALLKASDLATTARAANE